MIYADGQRMRTAFLVDSPVSKKHATEIAVNQTPKGWRLLNVSKALSAGWYQAVYEPDDVPLVGPLWARFVPDDEPGRGRTMSAPMCDDRDDVRSGEDQIINLADRIRSEAAISDRPGQLGRLEEIAAEVENLLRPRECPCYAGDGEGSEKLDAKPDVRNEAGR